MRASSNEGFRKPLMMGLRNPSSSLGPSITTTVYCININNRGLPYVVDAYSILANITAYAIVFGGKAQLSSKLN